jgi:penicillin-binding protein 1A
MSKIDEMENGDLKSGERHDCQGLLLLARIVGRFFALGVWLGTCGFQGIPSPREIQAYRPERRANFDRTGRLMGRTGHRPSIEYTNRAGPVHVRQAFVAAEDRRYLQAQWQSTGAGLLRRERFAMSESFGVREGAARSPCRRRATALSVQQYRNRSLTEEADRDGALRGLMEKSLTQGPDSFSSYLETRIYLGNGVYGIEARAEICSERARRS